MVLTGIFVFWFLQAPVRLVHNICLSLLALVFFHIFVCRFQLLWHNLILNLILRLIHIGWMFIADVVHLIVGIHRVVVAVAVAVDVVGRCFHDWCWWRSVTLANFLILKTCFWNWSALHIREMSKKIEFKIVAGYPEWIVDENWSNRGKCNNELPHHKMLQKPGKNGHSMTQWICTNTVSLILFTALFERQHAQTLVFFQILKKNSKNKYQKFQIDNIFMPKMGL